MKMNGECVTYSLNRPMRWDEYKKMPDDIRRQYIENLQKRFNVMQKDVAEMFGVSCESVRVEQKKLNITFPKGGGKHNANNGAWHDFLAGKTAPKPTPPTEVKPAEPVLPTSTPVTKPEPEKPEKPVEQPKPKAPETNAVPMHGNLFFENCSPVDALNLAFAVLGRSEVAQITIAWSRETYKGVPINAVCAV